MTPTLLRCPTLKSKLINECLSVRVFKLAAMHVLFYHLSYMYDDDSAHQPCKCLISHTNSLKESSRGAPL